MAQGVWKSRIPIISHRSIVVLIDLKSFSLEVACNVLEDKVIYWNKKYCHWSIHFLIFGAICQMGAVNYSMPESKICESCGRDIEYRKKWARDWAQVKFCSDKCRKNKNKHDYRDPILALLRLRQHGQTICPSEVLPKDQKSDTTIMEHVRRSARLLAADGFIEITQKGKAVDPLNFRGPIRLRLK